MKALIYCPALLMLMFADPLQSNTQSLESDPASYRAYLKPSAAEGTQAWTDIVAATAVDAKKNPESEDGKFKLALAQFGLLYGTMRSKDETLFTNHVDATIANLEFIKGKHAFEAQALLGAVLGLQMAYDPSKGAQLGRRSSSLLGGAIKGDAQSPLVWKLYANSLLHTPEAYGGNVGEAIVAYEKAIALYERVPASTKNNWLYLDTMAFLGQAYVRSGQSSKAVAVYQKALKTEPSFGWVTQTLLPAAQSGAK